MSPELQVNTLQPVRAAREGDLDWILKLQYLCYQGEARRYDAWSLDALTQDRRSLRLDLTTSVILVARLHDEEGAEVIGSVRGRLEGTVVHVGRLIVHPRFQRGGLGTRLLNTLLASLPTHYPQARTAEAYTGDRSVEFQSTYLRCGMRESRRERVSELLELVYYETPIASGVGPGLATAER